MFLFWCDDVVVVVHSSWECEPNCGKIYDKRWSHQCTMLLLLLADGAQRYRNGCTGFDFMFDFDFQCPTATAREDFIVNLLRWWSGDDANTNTHTRVHLENDWRMSDFHIFHLSVASSSLSVNRLFDFFKTPMFSVHCSAFANDIASTSGKYSDSRINVYSFIWMARAHTSVNSPTSRKGILSRYDRQWNRNEMTRRKNMWKCSNWKSNLPIAHG